MKSLVLELDELISEAHDALRAPYSERVSRALLVLPKLVDALDRVARRRAEFTDARAQLTQTVRAMREQVWDAQKRHPEVTYNGGQIQRTMLSLQAQLDQLALLLYPPEDGHDDQPA